MHDSIPDYGGRRARLLAGAYVAADRLGLLRAERRVEWPKVKRLVMVCKGNICRSPYAHVRARSMGIEAISCGLECSAGAPANEAAIVNAGRRNIDLRAHRTLPLSETLLRPGDLILAMEPRQARRIAPLARATGAQLSLLGLWSGHPHIPDPYGLGHGAFQSCYTLIDASLASIRPRLQGAAVPWRAADPTTTL